MLFVASTATTSCAATETATCAFSATAETAAYAEEDGEHDERDNDYYDYDGPPGTLVLEDWA